MTSKIRKQIYIEAQRETLLKESARRAGLSEAEIIRQAIRRHCHLSCLGLERVGARKSLHRPSRKPSLAIGRTGLATGGSL